MTLQVRAANRNANRQITLPLEIWPLLDKWSNAIWRPLIPNDLFRKCTVTQIIDEGAKLLSAVFMYGERRGKLKEIPYDDSEVNNMTNLSTESLWIYDSAATLDVPVEFKAFVQKPFMISTGKTHKCGKCRGTGKVTCSSCGGKIQWREKQGDELVEKTCSCGDGKQHCGVCEGFAYLLQVIVCESAFKLSAAKTQDYSGEIPKTKLAKTTGRVLLEEILEYPQDLMKKMLQGGIDRNEYRQVQEFVQDGLHQIVSGKLRNYDGNLELVHRLVDDFFRQMPNPGKDNVLLEYEVLPLRLKVQVEDAPVYQIHYLYKSRPYQIWVYGNERKIYAKKKPFEFTSKMVMLLEALAIIGVSIAIFIAYRGTF